MLLGLREGDGPACAAGRVVRLLTSWQIQKQRVWTETRGGPSLSALSTAASPLLLVRPHIPKVTQPPKTGPSHCGSHAQNGRPEPVHI